MSIRIVTGYTGTNHITSTDDRSKNAGLFGGELTDVNVLDIGNKFAYSLSGNTFTIASGEGIAQGVHFRIPYGSTESVTIAAGSQGMNRMDLVGVLYKKNTQTGVESIETKVIKGTATSGTPQPPAYTSGNLYYGDAECFFIMYIVRLSGTAIADVTSTLEPISSLEDMSDDIALAKTDITGLTNRTTALETKVGTTSISGSGKSNITALLGGVNIQSIAATVTAAIVALKNAIDAAVTRIATLEGRSGSTTTTVAKSSSFSASTWGCTVFTFYQFEFIYFNVALPALTSGTAVTMCTLPAGTRPSQKINYNHHTQESTPKSFLLEFETGGAVKITPQSAISSGAFFRGTFVLPIA